mmetsp:Transcript_101314/g.163422  ORF Transcript_101314/g.163422 Transcript_101314/m.163422 type:complete len:241 (-) Transcript_101314:153-875(-)
MTDSEGQLTSVSLAGVCRAIIPKVRQVTDKPLLVADKWKVYLDDIPPSSYMHTLERLRVLSNECNREHNARRQLVSLIAATMTQLEICDELAGSCDTQALLDLGPEVYAKANEIMAARSNDFSSALPRSSEERWMLETMDTLAQRYADRIARWSDLWPEWGDEKDGELRLLRCMSFTAWHSLGASVTTSELNSAVNSCGVVERFESAMDQIKDDRRKLQRTQRVLDKLQSNLGTVTKRRD